MEYINLLILDPIVAMVTAPAFWVLVAYSLSDACRDKFNLASNKWPNSGFRLMRRGWGLRRAFTKDTNASLEVEGFRLVVTVDLWHVIKWIGLYTITVFVLSFVPTVMGKIHTTLLCSLVWKLVPKPAHWK